MTQRIAIFGATSAIAEAFARRFAAEGARFYLVGRHPERLQAVAADLRVRGAVEAVTVSADFATADCRALCADAASRLERIDVAMVAHGQLPDQSACEADAALLHETFAVNLESHAQLLLGLAAILERQGSGTLVAIGSAAGDRGKKSNYIYGSAKAAIAVLQQGLMARLKDSGVHVLLVKPGFVDTPMTAHFKKGLLWIGPDRAAAAIAAAIASRQSTIYVPFFWRFIMLGLRALPDRVFVRLGL